MNRTIKASELSGQHIGKWVTYIWKPSANNRNDKGTVITETDTVISMITHKKNGRVLVRGSRRSRDGYTTQPQWDLPPDSELVLHS